MRTRAGFPASAVGGPCPISVIGDQSLKAEPLQPLCDGRAIPTQRPGGCLHIEALLSEMSRTAASPAGSGIGCPRSKDRERCHSVRCKAKVISGYRAPFRRAHRSFQTMLEFADVAFPIMLLECEQGIVGETDLGAISLAASRCFKRYFAM